nr:MAG TPA_asm: hypothetical protein [Bacteriophage sp.]
MISDLLNFCVISFCINDYSANVMYCIMFCKLYKIYSISFNSI